METPFDIATPPLTSPPQRLGSGAGWAEIVEEDEEAEKQCLRQELIERDNGFRPVLSRKYRRGRSQNQ